MTFLTRLEAIKDLIQEAVEKGANTVEQVHSTISAMPLDALEKRGLLDHQARDVHDATVGSIYDAIRRINKEVGDLASGLIETVEDQVAAQKHIGK